jgi:TPR repeat protein
VAFLVGVGQYKFNFSDLGTAPERDVTALAKTLSAGGFEVVALTGSADGAGRATKKNMEDRFKQLLDGGGNADRALGKGDLVLVHLCGHGFQAEAVDPVTGKKEEQPFFCPVDALPNKPESMVSLNALISATEPRGVTALFLIDACRELTDPNRGTRGGVQGNKVTLRKNTAVLFACGQGQLSHQSEKAAGGHGLFTFAVLKTIRSNMAGGGKVSWSQLVTGVEESFQSDEFRRLLPEGRVQTPVEAKGELGFTGLITDPLARDWAAMLDAVVHRGTPHLIYFRRLPAGQIEGWKKAAEAGSVFGMVLYGDTLLTGPAKDERKAAEWFRKAVDAGFTAALNELAYMYAGGLGGLPKDEAKALRMWTQAAEAGWTRSMLNVGHAHMRGIGTPKDDQKAAEWFRKAEARGDAMAVCMLADFHVAGQGGVPKDMKKSAELFRRATELGVPNAMVGYGAMKLGLIPDTGVAVDHREALRLFREAAELECPDADYFLSLMYANGQGGLKQDAAEARRLMKKAADAGSQAAIQALKQPEKK